MVCTAFMAHDVCPLSVPAVVHRNKCLCYSAIGLYLRSLRADNVRGTARIRLPLLQRLIDIQWCIAKNGGGYTQRGVAKGFKVSCLFMITEVSIRYQKNPRRLVYGIAYTPAYIPQYTTVDISCAPSVCPSHTQSMVPSIARYGSVRRICCWAPPSGSTAAGAQQQPRRRRSTPISGKCEQCDVYSDRRRLNTDFFAYCSRMTRNIDSGGSTLGRGGAHAPPPKSWLGSRILAHPPNLAVLLTHCGQLILRKISKFDVTRCHNLRLKCTKFYFR